MCLPLCVCGSCSASSWCGFIVVILVSLFSSVYFIFSIHYLFYCFINAIFCPSANIEADRLMVLVCNQCSHTHEYIDTYRHQKCKPVQNKSSIYILNIVVLSL